MPEPVRPWFRRPFAIFGAVILILVLAWSGYFAWQVIRAAQLLSRGQDLATLMKQKKFQASIAKTLANTKVTAEDLSRIEAADEPTLGNPKATVRIVEFVDYQCPYSRQVAPVLRSFMRTHANDAFLIVRDFPIVDLHPDAERVAIAARCIYEQKNADRYWSYHDRLFASQEALSAADLRLYAQQAGAAMTTFDLCVANARTLARVRRSHDDGVAAGVGGTPTFFFNGVKIEGAPDAESLEVIFQEAKKNARTL